jgi:hypothetical protein
MIFNFQHFAFRYTKLKIILHIKRQNNEAWNETMPQRYELSVVRQVLAVMKKTFRKTLHI